MSAACKTLHRVLGRLLYSTALTVVPYSIFMMLCTGKKFCSRRGVTGEGSDYFFHEGGRHFLSPLQAVPGEEPFVFVKKAAECLENHTVKRKEVLDQILADIIKNILSVLLVLILLFCILFEEALSFLEESKKYQEADKRLPG